MMPAFLRLSGRRVKFRLRLEAVGIELQLSDLYEGIRFDEDAPS